MISLETNLFQCVYSLGDLIADIRFSLQCTILAKLKCAKEGESLEQIQPTGERSKVEQIAKWIDQLLDLQLITIPSCE